MPTDETKSICGRRAPRRQCKFNGVRNDHVQDSGLVNGITHNDKITHACGPISIDRSQFGTHNDMKPRNMVNGYVNHGFWSKRTKTPCVFKKENKESPTPDNSTTKQSVCNTSVLANGASSPERGSLPTSVCDLLAPDHDQPVTTKSQRKKKKPRHKKRYNKVTSPENNAPQVQEDWESEIQEVKISNWEKMSFGSRPYGPEDVVNFFLRDLTMERTNTPLWQVTANYYFPAAHHQMPLEWFRYKPPTEPGQFSDVDE